MIRIQYAENGWLLTHSEDGESDKLHVFSHYDDEQTEAEAFRDLLATVNGLLGPSSSRYSAHRIYIRVEPGDKHASHPDNLEDGVL
jgi:hypothetical protein